MMNQDIIYTGTNGNSLLKYIIYINPQALYYLLDLQDPSEKRRKNVNIKTKMLKYVEVYCIKTLIKVHLSINF